MTLATEVTTIELDHDDDEEEDREVKKRLMFGFIESHANETSEFEDLREIGSALKAGDKLDAIILSGGKTNYSYKVFLEGQPDKALFAKISFSYALWNPDRSAHYDLKRTENEFKMMQWFSDKMGEGAPVATPYLCVDVSTDMKLLVAQWVPADEQWANQFIDGHVDNRLVPKVAQAFATLSLAEVEDPYFNDGVRPCMRSLFPQLKDIFADMIKNADNKPIDPFVTFGKELGVEAFNRLIDNLDQDYNKRDVLCHSDSHVFNILVEKKPHPDDNMKQFGENGSFYICDWEMAFAGPIGRDPGIWQFWPIACALCHAVQGHKEEAYGLIHAVEAFWESYAIMLMEEGGKDEEFMARALRSTFAWTAFFLTGVVYMLGIFQDALPIEGVSSHAASQAVGTIGALGLLLLQYGVGDKDPELNYTELMSVYKTLLKTEIENMLEVAKASHKFSRRRSSMLRQAGRRVSVSDVVLLEEAVRRTSSILLDRTTLSFVQQDQDNVSSPVVTQAQF
jgi:hypothetical protein